MAAPTATPVPPTDGEGDEPVVGRLSQPDLVHEFTIKNVGDVTQYRGGVATFRQDMNDSRITGLARFEASIDQWTKAGTEWGTYTVTNEGGSWTGSCTGGVWADGNGIAWGCWLEGTGAYAGYTFFQAITKDVGEEPQIHGVIYQGAPPAG